MKGFKKGYCKYCYKQVDLIIEGDVIECAKCGSSIAPLVDAMKFKSFNKWRMDLLQKWHQNYNYI